jgi:hypothetical protein
MARAFRPEGVVSGLALVAVGVVWTLGNLGEVDALLILRTWWPLTLIVWGALELAATLTRRTSAGRS